MWFQLSEKQPQPQRICSKCIKQIRAISSFRDQCMDADNILNEFQKHLDYKSSNIELTKDPNNLFDANDMISEDFEDSFPNGFEPELIKLEPNEPDYSSVDHNSVDISELESMSPILEQPREPTPVVVRRPASNRKVKRPNHYGDADKYIDQLVEEDITASLKSLEKKYKKNDAGGLCEQCGLSFTSATEYKKHVRSHDDKGKFE